MKALPKQTNGLPPKQGLYDPWFEHEACGVGFVVHVKGKKSHQIIQQALQVLRNLGHRGACGCEANTGDGAGILMQVPHRFLLQECDRLNISLPPRGEYGVGMVYLPTDPDDRRQCEIIFEQIIQEEGQQVLGWRTVPTNNSPIGPTAKRAEPSSRQIFVGRRAGSVMPPVPGRSHAPLASNDPLAFERQLYIIRKRAENAVKKSAISQRGMFYIPSFSCKTIVYKGMLKADQIPVYYPDVANPAVESALAMV